MTSLHNLGVRIQRNGDYKQAVWTDSRGRRRVKSLGRVTMTVARQKARALAASHILNPASRDAAHAPTLEAWCTRYLEGRDDLTEGTRTLHEETIARLKAFFPPSVRIDRIKRDGAADWRAWLAKQTHRKELLSEATVCRHVRTAKVIFGAALEQDFIGFNPFDRLKGTPGVVEKDWRQFTEAEIDRLIQAGPTAAWRSLLALCALAGLRRGEAMRLRWDDIQWERRRLVVRTEHGVETTKQRRREVLLVPALERLLLDAREVESGELVAPVPPNNLHRQTIAIVTRAGFERWGKPLHTLRKWRATSWRSDYPEHVVDAWLGHSLQVARRHYVAVPDGYYAQNATIQPQNAASVVKK